MLLKLLIRVHLRGAFIGMILAVICLAANAIIENL